MRELHTAEAVAVNALPPFRAIASGARGGTQGRPKSICLNWRVH